MLPIKAALTGLGILVLILLACSPVDYTRYDEVQELRDLIATWHSIDSSWLVTDTTDTADTLGRRRDTTTFTITGDTLSHLEVSSRYDTAVVLQEYKRTYLAGRIGAENEYRDIGQNLVITVEFDTSGNGSADFDNLYRFDSLFVDTLLMSHIEHDSALVDSQSTITRYNEKATVIETYRLTKLPPQ
ncbi:MAG: hypothetical protein GF398_09970 [Chitinivibrionales bacterium]|nr:hypothetical protein [Chitinivibrionales bacterium]